MNYNELTCEELQNILENQIDYKLLVYDAKQEKINLGLTLHKPSSSQFGYQGIYAENQINYERKLKEIEEIEPKVIPERLKFLNVFDTLFYKSADENYYWEHCTFKVYNNTFDERFEAYKKINIDAELVDFVKSEKNILMFLDGTINFPFYITVEGNSFNTLLIEGFDTTKIDLALKKKREFLENIINSNDGVVKESIIENINEYKNEKIAENSVLNREQISLLGRLLYENAYVNVRPKPSQGKIAESLSNIFGYSNKSIINGMTGQNYLDNFKSEDVNNLKILLNKLIEILNNKKQP